MTNKILLVDDRQDFADSFTQESLSRGITVIHKKSFVGLTELLPRHHRSLAAVVLDIRCLMTDSQEKEEASFITQALSYLDREASNFPRYILTGDDKAFEQIKGLFTHEKVYLKTPDNLEELYVELNNCIANSEFYAYRREFHRAFSIFDSGKMNGGAESLFFQILKQGLQEIDFIKFKGILADIRSFQELLYKSLNQRNNTVVPDNMFKNNGMIKFNDLMRHLNGGVFPPAQPTGVVYQNSTIYNFSNSLYWSCGEYIHEDPSRTYFISDNVVKSMVYNLMELIIWSDQY